MNRGKAAIGLALLCALAISAIATASVSANTAHACEKIGPGAAFDDAHCIVGNPGKGEYSHVQILAPIIVTATNANTMEETKAARVSRLKGSAAALKPKSNAPR
jgi:hypothetical protein